MGRALLVLQSDHDRETACRWARGVPLGSRIEFKETKRSLPQNDLMWALLTEVAQQMEHGGRKYSADEWKAIFLHAFGREISFLPSLDMKTFLPIELSSSDLSKDEMTNFIEFILKEGTERGVIFHDPNTPPSAEKSPSPADVDGTPPAEASTMPSQEPADQPSPKSAGSVNSDPELSDEDRRSLIGCYAQLMTIPETEGISVQTKRDILEGAKDEWKLTLPDHLHRHLRSIVLSIDGIIKGHDKLKAANEYAGFFGCPVEELIGGGNG
jgi:hypothetical protein